MFVYHSKAYKGVFVRQLNDLALPRWPCDLIDPPHMQLSRSHERAWRRLLDGKHHGARRDAATAARWKRREGYESMTARLTEWSSGHSQPTKIGRSGMRGRILRSARRRRHGETSWLDSADKRGRCIYLTCFALHSLNFRLLLLRLLARRDRDRRAAPALHSGEHEIGIVGDVAEDVT